MFGFATKADVRLLEEALATQQKAHEKELETLHYEWADWYGKFRLLHARLMKAEKKATQDAPDDTNGDDPALGDPPPVRSGFRSRRLF
jgi:hypothetical protein